MRGKLAEPRALTLIHVWVQVRLETKANSVWQHQGLIRPLNWLKQSSKSWWALSCIVAHMKITAYTVLNFISDLSTTMLTGERSGETIGVTKTHQKWFCRPKKNRLWYWHNSSEKVIFVLSAPPCHNLLLLWQAQPFWATHNISLLPLQ